MSKVHSKSAKHQHASKPSTAPESGAFVLLTTEEVARLVEISPRSLEKWRLRPGVGIPYVKLPNGRVRYRRDAVYAWLLSRETA